MNSKYRWLLNRKFSQKLTFLEKLSQDIDSKQSKYGERRPYLETILFDNNCSLDDLKNAIETIVEKDIDNISAAYDGLKSVNTLFMKHNNKTNELKNSFRNRRGPLHWEKRYEYDLEKMLPYKRIHGSYYAATQESTKQIQDRLKSIIPSLKDAIQVTK